MNNKSDPAILAQDELMQTDNSMSVDEYLAQLHADYDPVYNILIVVACSSILMNWASGLLSGSGIISLNVLLESRNACSLSDT